MKGHNWIQTGANSRGTIFECAYCSIRLYEDQLNMINECVDSYNKKVTIETQKNQFMCAVCNKHLKDCECDW
jgi:hypothetical protein